MHVLFAFIVTMSILLIALVKLKISPGIALFSCAIIMAMLSGISVMDTLGHLVNGFGGIMSSIGLQIIFGGIFGVMLGDSGAMEELAKAMLRTFGRKNDILALNLAGYIIFIPVYFSPAYITLSPLVDNLQKFTPKKGYVYASALFTGLLLSHCIIPPSPGPLAVADQLGANIGWFIIYGIMISLPATLLCGWQYANILNIKSSKIGADSIVKDSDLLKANPSSPAAGLTLGLIALPIMLIVTNSLCSALLPADNLLTVVFTFIGNNNIALFIAMLVAAFSLHRNLIPRVTEDIWAYIDKISDSLGNFLMVIGCGNCFGLVLQKSGLGDALVELLSDFNIPIILLAFLLAMIVRAAVGSGTVAMLTTAAIVGPSAVNTGLSPVIVGLSICAGTVGMTLPTDAAFWLPARYNNLSVNESFTATTYPTTLASMVSFALLLIMNAFSGILPGLY